MLIHQPVLVEEVLEGLAIRTGATVLDATVGLGGHAESFLKAVGPKGRLIGLDRDSQALEYAGERLKKFRGQMQLIHGHFGELAAHLDKHPIGGLDAAFFDLGVSSYQLETAERGFSFNLEGPLDMRMDPTEDLTAARIVNRASVEELSHLLRSFGEERWASRIARTIVRNRPFSTTTQLADAIRQAVPAQARHGRIDAATRTFQAIRITVNRELELLQEGLLQAIARLKPGGRIAVLAYHSLEDRIVKVTFRDQARKGILEILTRKPIRPSEAEVARNPRSRSAHLRVAERLSETSAADTE